MSAISGTSTIADFPCSSTTRPQQLDVDERLAAAGDAVQQRDVARLRERESRDRVRLRVGGVCASGGAPARVRKGSRSTVSVADLHEPALHEAREHGAREVELLVEHLERRASTEFLDQLVERALLRRAREQLVALHQRRQLLRDLDDAPRLARWNRRARAGERRGQRAAQRDAEWHDVVVGDPAAEGEHVLVHHGRDVGRGDDVLELRAVARLRCADDDAQLVAVAEWNDDARAGREAARQALGHAVGEGAKEREREGDVDQAHRTEV